jgi:hypothetical protein
MIQRSPVEVVNTMRVLHSPLCRSLPVFCLLVLLGGCDFGVLGERGEAGISGDVPPSVRRVVIHQGEGSVRVVGSAAEGPSYRWSVEALCTRGQNPAEAARAAMRVTRRAEGDGEAETMIFALQEDSNVGCRLRSEMVLVLAPQTEVVVEGRKGRITLEGLDANALVCGTETAVTVEQMAGPVQVTLEDGELRARGLQGERAGFDLAGKTRVRIESCSAPCAVTVERAEGEVRLHDLTGGLKVRAQQARLALQDVTDADLEVVRGNVAAEGMRGRWKLRCERGDFTGTDASVASLEAALERGDFQLVTNQGALKRVEIGAKRGNVRIERGRESPLVVLDLEGRRVRVHGADEGGSYRAGTGEARWAIQARRGNVLLTGEPPAPSGQ